METCAEYRRRARLCLGGSLFSNDWLMMVVATLINSAISYVTGLSGFFTIVFVIVIAGPLTFGVTRFVLNTVKNNPNKNNLSEIFSGFRVDFGGSIGLYLYQMFLIFLWSLLFIIPGIIKALSYSMAFYIKADHPEFTYKQCIEESMLITEGKKGKLFLLGLSFIGWYIVGALCLGIGILWADAYSQTAIACFYEDVKPKPIVNEIYNDKQSNDDVFDI